MCDDPKCPENAATEIVLKISKTADGLFCVSVEGSPKNMEWITIIEEVLLKKSIKLAFKNGTTLNYDAIPLSSLYDNIPESEYITDHIDLRDEMSNEDFVEEVFGGDEEKIKKALDFPLLMNTYYKQGKDHKIVSNPIGDQINDIIKKASW